MRFVRRCDQCGYLEDAVGPAPEQICPACGGDVLHNEQVDE